MKTVINLALRLSPFFLFYFVLFTDNERTHGWSIWKVIVMSALMVGIYLWTKEEDNIS